MAALTPTEPPSFAQALHLVKLGTAPERYISTFPALSYDYAPNQPLSLARSYGGHAFAQAIWAASQGISTSNPDLHVHEANGYWTQAGFANRPFIYEATTLSLTRSFALRQVTARQPTIPSEECPFPESDAEKNMGPVAFVLTCSFKRRELGSGYGLKFDVEEYGGVLRKELDAHPRHVYLRGPNGQGLIRLADFPSIDVRTPDLREYNGGKRGTSHRRLHVYRASSGRLGLHPNLLAALHAYVSDRAGLDVLRHAFGVDEFGVSGSLNHKIVFHVSPEEMALDDKTWFVQEMSSSRGGDGRGLIESRMWSPSGTLVATTVQDALFRRAQAKLA
ncbi:thioesterase-like superfamily-domain-containing protein [Aspergillus pseudoustus]|uniref:Thioesterase-like superfamily-domain-containing protein n=1 Tax=Aspergillus pseudoustus TaxID=1810923 RepID=A0ABR4KI06_9EURO